VTRGSRSWWWPLVSAAGLVAALLGTAGSPAAAAASNPATAPMKPAASSAAGSPAVQRQGYIRMSDGAELGYAVDLPRSRGRFPVALVYDGYCEQAGPLACNDAYAGSALLKAGYAVLGVSIRGTSCSTGTFDAFTPQEMRDGKAVIEWAARQPWSTGHVGMFGDSFPGIMTLGVAGLRPAHLDAIAPWQVTSDIYRDVAYPGGIVNVGFGAFWAGVDQPLNSYESGANLALQTKNVTCLGALARDAANEPQYNVALQALQHPYIDGFWKARTPGANADKIDVPALGCLTWQDDEVSSRGASFLNHLDPSRTWVVASNGFHGQCDLQTPRVRRELVGFFNRYVKGEHNGFTRTPHVQLWHDTTTDRAGHHVPSWISTFSSLKAIPVRPLALYFRSNGVLALHPPKGHPQPRNYAYPGVSAGNEDGDVAGQHNMLWQAGETPGASLAYTTAPLTQATEFYGSGSANLWLSSTAPDTDLQITLTEVKPDGQEVYIARGWLRANQRHLDTKRSTALAPYQTDTKSTVEPLTVGKPTYMRVQLDPFDYVFQKGSSIRLWIDAPAGMTGGWILDPLNLPVVNSVYADAAHPSSIVLGHLTRAPGKVAAAKAAAAACNTVLNQPCRTSSADVPSGHLSIR